VSECCQKFIFHLGFVTQQLDEGLPLLQEVSYQVLIAASVQGDSGNACKGSYSHRTLYEIRA
jgi:hypothetical protein